MYKFVLASKSPRRKELLTNIGMTFEVIESQFDETTVSKDLSPEMYVKELAMYKAMSLLKQVQKDTLVIGADTVVVLGDKILGKPIDKYDAMNMLCELSGRVHSVYTGICVSRSNDAKTVATCVKTDVYFKKLTAQEIEYYVDNYAPFDKAGSYGIQEYAGVFVERIDGDYFNIVGLPVCKLNQIINDEF